jgi:hypothetical protein
MLAFSLANLLIISSGPLSSFFAEPLDARYDGRPFVDKGEAIVVLAGGCSPPDMYRPYTSLAVDSYGRSLSAAWLYHSKPPRSTALVVYAGRGQEYATAEGSKLREGLGNLIATGARLRERHRQPIGNTRQFAASH